MKNDGGCLFSSSVKEWETPKELFEALDREYHFTLDAASTHENALCSKHYTAQEDGLAQSWAGETVFCNPPYDRHVDRWVRKARAETENGATTVLLIPARTDTRMFHDLIKDRAEVVFLRGRLMFTLGGVKRTRAPFPSMLVVFRASAP